MATHRTAVITIVNAMADVMMTSQLISGHMREA